VLARDVVSDRPPKLTQRLEYFRNTPLRISADEVVDRFVRVARDVPQQIDRQPRESIGSDQPWSAVCPVSPIYNPKKRQHHDEDHEKRQRARQREHSSSARMRACDLSLDDSCSRGHRERKKADQNDARYHQPAGKPKQGDHQRNNSEQHFPPSKPHHHLLREPHTKPLA
jgi:hypothetical protein